MDKTTIIDHIDMGVIKVKYDGVTLGEFLYCRDFEERQYLTHDSALEMAKRFARSLYAYDPINSTKGLYLCPKHISIQES